MEEWPQAEKDMYVAVLDVISYLFCITFQLLNNFEKALKWETALHRVAGQRVPAGWLLFGWFAAQCSRNSVIEANRFQVIMDLLRRIEG